MEQKFGQFKIMQQELQEIPTVKSEAHFKLNDLAKKTLNGEEITNDDINVQELIYSELQDLEKDLVTNLDDYRSRAILRKEEFLIVANYFLIAKQLGPHSDELVEVFKKRTIKIGDCVHLIQATSIPEHTKTILCDVYSKIYNE